MNNPHSDPEVGTDAYDKAHECCPRCGAPAVSERVFPFAGLHADANVAKCECGWVGTVHDLISEEYAYGDDGEVEILGPGADRADILDGVKTFAYWLVAMLIFGGAVWLAVQFGGKLK
jgi:hypothetical protein